MVCGCHSANIMRGERRGGMKKLPDTPCVFCAHKHIAAAKQLYDLELNYRNINKSYAIGQLILAAWHYEKEHHNLALRCRDIWLKMERLDNVSSMLSELQNSAWNLVLAESPEQKTKPLNS